MVVVGRKGDAKGDAKDDAKDDANESKRQGIMSSSSFLLERGMLTQLGYLQYSALLSKIRRRMPIPCYAESPANPVGDKKTPPNYHYNRFNLHQPL